MKAITDFSLSFAQGVGLKAGMAEGYSSLKALERIATGLSLISKLKLPTSVSYIPLKPDLESVGPNKEGTDAQK
jgi:hypothetical protein